MDVYGPIFRSVLFPAWETVLRSRPTLARRDFLERTQWLSLDELLALQTGALRRLVRHCYEAVPFYRDRMRAAGVRPEDIRTLDDLRAIPPLTRQDARASTKRRVATTRPRATIKKTTGGTTGEPLLFGYEADSEYWRTAMKLRGYGWAGSRLGEYSLHYWGAPTRANAARTARFKVALDRTIRRDHFVDCGLRSDEELARVVEIVRTRKPRSLICYTQAGGDLARYVLSRGLRDWGTIPVICGAERLFQHDRDALERAFGPAVFETYGCREVMLIASECAAHDGMHESMENVLVEILVKNADGSTRAAREGELGEVVLTDLHNYSMPFLRYANGDLALAGPSSPCSCGRGLRRIRAVEGRSTESLRNGDGERVSGMVFNLIISPIAPTVRQFQAVQHRDTSITLKIVPTDLLDASAIDHIRTSCEKYLKGVPVRVERVQEIALSASGKRQPVVVEP